MGGLQTFMKYLHEYGKKSCQNQKSTSSVLDRVFIRAYEERWTYFNTGLCTVKWIHNGVSWEFKKIYLIGLPGKENSIGGGRVMRKVKASRGASKASQIASSRIRKHLVTMEQII